MKRIGVLTSGGDAPGMNAAIRAVVRSAIDAGLEVKGIIDGYNGLMTDKVIEMDLSSVDDIVSRGGTILGSARDMDMHTEEGQNRAVDTVRKHGIDGLIVIGGDGSFLGANALHLKGVKTIGIPGTIDNDMGYTESTIGFASACETVKLGISYLRDTAASHKRVNIVEVMGRHCGDLALRAGIAAGGESILVPEIDYDIDQIVGKIKKTRQRGKRHHIIVVAEGVKDIPKIVDEIAEKSGVPTRLTVLGHVQRGGSPVTYDAMIAGEMGIRAVRLLLEGQSSQAIGIKYGKVYNMPITEAVEIESEFNEELYRLADILSY